MSFLEESSAATFGPSPVLLPQARGVSLVPPTSNYHSISRVLILKLFELSYKSDFFRTEVRRVSGLLI